MLIAISARGADLDADVDVRFGRAAAFILVDTVAGTTRALDNRAASGAGQGAGIQAAQVMAANDVHAVLTGHCGPNAYRALQAAGITVYTGLAGGSVREAVERYKAGTLQQATGADVQRNW